MFNKDYNIFYVNILTKWTMPIETILAQLSIYYEDRIGAYL
jgi:hypothetical protein